jgi:CBS domain-containing protein
VNKTRIKYNPTAVFDDAVSTHMTTKMVTTSEDESVDVAMEKMTNERSRHLLVISHEKLVGLVSIGDLVKYRLGACEYEHNAMREYIATG